MSMFVWAAVGFVGCCVLAIGFSLIVIAGYAGPGAVRVATFGAGLMAGGLLVWIFTAWQLSREVRRRS